MFNVVFQTYQFKSLKQMAQNPAASQELLPAKSTFVKARPLRKVGSGTPEVTPQSKVRAIVVTNFAATAALETKGGALTRTGHPPSKPPPSNLTMPTRANNTI